LNVTLTDLSFERSDTFLVTPLEIIKYGYSKTKLKSLKKTFAHMGYFKAQDGVFFLKFSIIFSNNKMF